MIYSQKLLSFLNEVQDFDRSRGDVWYRGHSRNSYRLMSGLFRNVYLRNKEDLKHLTEVEISMYAQFLNQGEYLHHRKEPILFRTVHLNEAYEVQRILLHRSNL